MTHTYAALAATLLTAALGLARPDHAQAQAFPSKPIRMIVPYSTGSATDALSRLIAQRLGENLKQQVVVDNQPGANGIPASATFVKTPPDGHSLMMLAANHVVNASLYAKLPFDTLKDFSPILRIAFAPFVLTVHPSLPVRDLKTFITFVKARPGQLNYGSPSNGSPAHLATELLKTQTGINLVHVPYKTSAQAQTDLLGGQIPTMFVVASAAIPQVKAARLRALGITSARRIAAAPEIPTLDEAGAKGFELISWIGLAGPAGMPQDVIARLSGEVSRIVQSAETSERIQRLGLEISLMSSTEFGAYMAKEQTRLGDVVRKAGARLD